MEIYIFEKINCEDKSPVAHRGTSLIKGRFIVVQAKDGISSFYAVGGESEEITSHSEILAEFSRDGEVIAGGLFGIFPEYKTVIFHGKTDAFRCSFTKEHVWPVVVKLARDGMIQHAIIAPFDFDVSFQSSKNPAIQAMASNYDAWDIFRYPVFSTILEGNNVVEKAIFNDVLNHVE